MECTYILPVHSVQQWRRWEHFAVQVVTLGDEFKKKKADSEVGGVEPGNGHTLLSQFMPFLTMETILSENVAWTTALAIGL